MKISGSCFVTMPSLIGVPQTGDNSAVYAALLALVSALGLAVLAVTRRKNGNE